MCTLTYAKCGPGNEGTIYIHLYYTEKAAITKEKKNNRKSMK